MGSSEASGPAVAAWLAAATGAAAVAVTGMERLGGGAIQENWGLDVVCRGGRLDGTHALVLRTDLGPASLVEMAVFIGVLVVALLHVWRRGLLRWW